MHLKGKMNRKALKIVHKLWSSLHGNSLLVLVLYLYSYSGTLTMGWMPFLKGFLEREILNGRRYELI